MKTAATGTMKTAALAALVFAAAFSSPASSRAQDISPEVRARGRRLQDEARAYVEREQWALAADTYRRIYELSREHNVRQAPIALWNVGLALMRIPGREAEARDAFRRFLDESTTLTDDAEIRDWRSTALEHIAELEARTRNGGPHVDEATRAELARIRDEAIALDDAGRYALAAQRYLDLHAAMQRAGLPRAPVALWSAGLALTRVPGRERDARATLQRFLAESTTLTEDAQIRDWRSTALEHVAELEARIGSATSAGGDAPGERREAPSGGISPVGPIVLGAGVLTLGVGAVFGALALTRENDLATRCGGLACLDTPEHRGIDDEMRTFGAVTDVLLVVGGVAGITGTILTFVLTEGGSTETSATASLRPGGAELAIRGRF